MVVSEVSIILIRIKNSIPPLLGRTHHPNEPSSHPQHLKFLLNPQSSPRKIHHNVIHLLEHPVIISHPCVRLPKRSQLKHEGVSVGRDHAEELRSREETLSVRKPLHLGMMKKLSSLG